MNAIRFVTTTLAACVIAGCATAQTPTEKRMVTVRSLLATGKFDMAIAVARSDFMIDSDESASVRKQFAGYPAVAPAFKFRIRAELETESEKNLSDSVPKAIKLAQRDGVISEMDAAELLQAVSVQADILARTLHIPSHVWEAMRLDQRKEIELQYVADPISAKSYGTIIDAQSLNESTPGSNTGSQIGAAIGQAAYIDNAFKGNTWNYSASGQLAAGFLGAVIGAAANTAPRVQYRTRYTIRMGDGKIEYIDETKAEPFRQTVGICVALAPIRAIEQSFCTITVGEFVVKHASRATSLVAEFQPPAVVSSSAIAVQPTPTPTDSGRTAGELLSGDIAWNGQTAITGYAAPSASAKKIKQIEKGTSFRVEVALKDWAKIRIENESSLWVQKQHLSWEPAK